MRAKDDLSFEEVDSQLSYDPASGFLHWKRNGKVAGHFRPNGYCQVNIGGRIHKAHRLAWLLHYGKWPVRTIDHIDRDKQNNRIANLRDVPHAHNLQNSRPKCSNVTRSWNKWAVNMRINGKKTYIGQFEDRELAELVALEAKIKYQPGFLGD